MAVFSLVHGARHGAWTWELPGGHSPMLSRPAELAELLGALV